MELVFLGTGAGCGVPAFYCGCKACKEALADRKYRRTRCAVALLGKKRFLFDAPAEVSRQLLREHIEAIDCLILTHAHHDHCAGLGDLEIYSRFHRKEPLPAIMSRKTLEALEQQSGSGQNWMAVTCLDPLQSILLTDVQVTALEVAHCPGALGYLIQTNSSNLAYIPDTGPLPDVTKGRLKGVEKLILDATFWGDNWYPTQHLSFEEAIATAQELKVGALYLTHLAMHYSTPVTSKEIENEIKKYKGQVRLAYDGWRLPLP